MPFRLSQGQAALFVLTSIHFSFTTCEPWQGSEIRLSCASSDLVQEVGRLFLRDGIDCLLVRHLHSMPTTACTSHPLEVDASCLVVVDGVVVGCLGHWQLFKGLHVKAVAPKRSSGTCLPNDLHKASTSVLSGATLPAAASSTFQLVTPHGLVFRPWHSE